jgi:hypothetical protein
MPKHFSASFLPQCCGFKLFQRCKKRVPGAPVKVEISLVTDEADAIMLAPIGVKCSEDDLLAQTFDISNSMLNRYTLSIWSHIINPSVETFKAVLRGSGKVVGFASLDHDTISSEKSRDDRSCHSLGVDSNIGMVHQEQMQEIRVKYLDGQEYVSMLRWLTDAIFSFKRAQQAELLLVLSGPIVLPEFKTVELDIMKWAFDHFRLEKQYVWVQVGLDERELYLTHSWEQVGFVDIDLSEWRGRNRGYGTYRTYGMVRKPGPFVNSAISKENHSL